MGENKKRTSYKVNNKDCGEIAAAWLISDSANQFYNAWVGVMERRPQKLACAWHVDKAWKENLKSTIGNDEIEEDIYKMLHALMEQTNEEQFTNNLDIFLSHLQSKEDTTDFHMYFVVDWVPRKHEWACCFRHNLGINTNMYLEAFHRVLKYNYLKGKYNKRVDNCLSNLLKYV